MPTDNGVYVLDKFKGMNRVGYKYNMDKDWIWDLLNGYVDVTPDGHGAIQQRDGISKYNTNVVNDSSTKIRCLFEAKFDNGSTAAIIRANAAWYRYSSGDFTSLDAGRTVDAKGCAVMWNNQLIMVDGGTPRKADSSWAVTDLSADGSMPTDATAVWVHENRMWLNSTANPMKFYGSKVGDATGASAWSTASDSITIDLSYKLPIGEEILGFRTLGKSLLVIFCKQHIVIYDAPQTYASIQIAQAPIKIGAISQFAIANIGNDWVYPGLAGVKSLIASDTSQNLDLNDLSYFINPLYREYIALETDNKSVCGVYFNALNHYYITIHSTVAGTSNTLVYSPEIKNFIGRFQFHANPYSWHELADGTLLIGMDNGFVFKYDTAVQKDDGNAMEFAYEPPLLGHISLHRYKAPREFEMLCEANQDTTINLDYYFGLTELSTNSVTFEINADESFWDEATWDVSSWDEAGREFERTVDLNGRGRSVGIKIWHNQSGTKVRIPYMILKCLMEGTK